MTVAADSQRRRLKFAAFVILVVSALLVFGYVNADQLAAVVSGVSTAVLGAMP